MFEYEFCYRYVDAEGYAMSEPAHYTGLACSECTELLLYLKSNLHSPTSKFGELAYPEDQVRFGGVPAVVVAAHSEAMSVRRTSKTAFMLLGRRVLEAICKDQGAWNRNLAMSVTALLSIGKIPPILKEASGLIRIFGNQAAHEMDEEFNEHHVDMVDQFLKILINHIYIIPSQLESYRYILDIEQGDA